MALERVADQPEGGWPEADEQRAALGVGARVLVDGLGTNPQSDAESDSSDRRQLHVAGAQSHAVEAFREHDFWLPGSAQN
jgi:hypothetical protein